MLTKTNFPLFAVFNPRTRKHELSALFESLAHARQHYVALKGLPGDPEHRFIVPVTVDLKVVSGDDMDDLREKAGLPRFFPRGRRPSKR